MPSKRVGFFRTDEGNVEALFDEPVYAINEVISDTNNSTVTFNVTTNITQASGRTVMPTVIWNITGTASASDFIDAEGMTNTLTLPTSGNLSITKNLDINSDSNVNFTFNLYTSDVNTTPVVTSNVINASSLAPITATGGTINVTTNTFQKYHTFTSNATFDITSVGDASIDSNMGNVDVLVVGGGGAGGFSNQSIWGEERENWSNDQILTARGDYYPEPANASYGSGGGGAGAVNVLTDVAVGVGSNSVVIGAGGICTLANATRDGSNTTFMGNTAPGGGGGGNGFLGWPGGAPLSAVSYHNSQIPGFDANIMLSVKDYNVAPYSNVNLYTNNGRDGTGPGAGGGGVGLSTKDTDEGFTTSIPPPFPRSGDGIAGVPGTGTGAGNGGFGLLNDNNDNDWHAIQAGGGGGGSVGNGQAGHFNGTRYDRGNGGLGTNASVTGNVVLYGAGGQGGYGPLVEDSNPGANTISMVTGVFGNESHDGFYDNTSGANVEVAGAPNSGHGGGAGANGGSGFVAVKYIAKRRYLNIT